jgi:hypothetical protein
MRLQAITRSRKCPARPAAIGARKPDSLADGKTTARDVACAGMWACDG